MYGSNSPTFTEFMAPGVILSITVCTAKANISLLNLTAQYFMAVGLTSISFIIERKEGLLDRSWIAGVTRCCTRTLSCLLYCTAMYSLEVMLAHVVAQFTVMLVQVGFVLLFMIAVFQV